MQNNALKRKTTLITGSTSGIGLGIAKVLASQGVNIIFNGFGDAQLIENLPRSVAQEYDVQTAYHNANMAKPAEIEAMMKFASDRFGGVDILVNNAGIQYVAGITEFPVEKWDEIISINLTASFHTIRLALPSMLAKNWGRIINISSAHGLIASKNKTAYISAKHGLIGLTKAVAMETATTGITCNAICPGWVLTPLVQKQVDDRAAAEGLSDAAMKKRMLEIQPSGEFVTTEQMGGAVAFLCSAAANQIRGISLPVDGGLVAQ